MRCGIGGIARGDSGGDGGSFAIVGRSPTPGLTEKALPHRMN